MPWMPISGGGMQDIVLEHTYAFSMEDVWEALTDPASLADWMHAIFKDGWGHKLGSLLEPVIARLSRTGT